ncbi:MAG: hypothetical protein ABI462_04140 [Ignavibacteria bacterium]
MTIKEKLKIEIDKIPEELADRVYKLIESEKKRKSHNIKKKILTAYHFGKELDELDVRKAAYE